MVRRARRSDQSGFWGCSTYPRCRGTRPLEAVKQVRPHDPPSPVAGAVPWDDPSWRRREAGESARATYERRRERHRARVRDARPRIIFFGLVLVIAGVALLNSPTTWAVAGWPLVLLGIFRTLSALFVEPPSVRAWAIGAGGEERLGSLLEPLEDEGFVVLHDLRIPGARENIDHLLIGPPGVFVVETKTYRGSVRVRGGELFIDGRRKTGFFDQVERQIAAVASSLEPTDIAGYICVLGGEFPWFTRPKARGIAVLPPRRLVEAMRSLKPVLEPSDVERLGRLAHARLGRR